MFLSILRKAATAIRQRLAKIVARLHGTLDNQALNQTIASNPSMYAEHKLLVANRGEIAVRILRTAKRLGIRSVAVYTPSDALAPHVALANESVMLQTFSDATGASESKAYLASASIVSICKEYNVTLVHPGYGFLSENADFATAILEAGIIWLGPQPDIIRMMGLKHEARAVALNAGLQLVPGSEGLVSNTEDALNVVKDIGFPVMLKATAGGGGMGLVVCHSESDLLSRFASTKERAQILFHNDGVFIERYYASARHIEVQVFGNGLGDVVHMGERECSVQRRHQKVIEETPSPFFAHHPGLRDRMCEAAVRLCKSIRYASAGTIEFLVDDTTGHFFFLEMNTRIQVEHAITELLHPGLDLVQLMIEQGIIQQKDFTSGLDLFSNEVSQAIYDANLEKSERHCIEARVYCEDPANGFRPSPGVLQLVDFCVEGNDEWLRIDHWISTGTTITPYFDPLLAKLVVMGSTRQDAIARLIRTLIECKIYGPPNNIRYLRLICESRAFAGGMATTKFLDNFPYVPRTMNVISRGIEMTIQDLPGRRIGLGIPRSGPMDSQAFSAANILVSNPREMEALEIITLPGAECRVQFRVSTVIAVTGKSVVVKIDGQQRDMWARLLVPANVTVEIGGGKGSTGFRNYLAVRGGFPEIPRFLGAKSTSMGLGGYQGRALIPGDQLTLGECEPRPSEIFPFLLPTPLIPLYPKEWIVYVLSGPHDDAEFITENGNAEFYAAKWLISPSSNRMGIRLEGKHGIEWARMNGGEGGAHPSNILDNGYALGTVNINGDTPIILTHEGPDMGGYVCLCTVASGELWKLGQLSPGSTVQFRRVTWQNAQICNVHRLQWLEAVEAAMLDDKLSRGWSPLSFEDETQSSKLYFIPPNPDTSRPAVTFRQAGDSAILIEYGPMHLDFHARARVHALETEAKSRNIPGIWVFAPCIRSTMCRYDPTIVSQTDLLHSLIEVEQSLPNSMTEVQFSGRKITFPIVLDDRWSREALQRYMTTTRDKAVYLPSNIDYLAKNNGLEGGAIEVLQRLIFSDHLVFGVGFYLACPFLIPIDPRSRLVGQKMNPSRTFTPRGAVGLAGPVAAIYPVESPGGYQLYGRTLPAWQTWGKGASFDPERPWLLRPFDQVHYEPVTEDEYLEIEKNFDAGRYEFKIEPVVFSMSEYEEFVQMTADEIALFQERQAQGMAREEARERELLKEWQAEKAAKDTGADVQIAEVTDDVDIGGKIVSSMPASIWKINCRAGDKIQSADDVVIILEAMKTEISVVAGEENVGKTIRGMASGVKEGSAVQAGDVLVLLD